MELHEAPAEDAGLGRGPGEAGLHPAQPPEPGQGRRAEATAQPPQGQSEEPGKGSFNCILYLNGRVHFVGWQSIKLIEEQIE